jgi:hypothetical protein
MRSATFPARMNWLAAWDSYCVMRSLAHGGRGTAGEVAGEVVGVGSGMAGSRGEKRGFRCARRGVAGYGVGFKETGVERAARQVEPRGDGGRGVPHHRLVVREIEAGADLVQVAHDRVDRLAAVLGEIQAASEEVERGAARGEDRVGHGCIGGGEVGLGGGDGLAQTARIRVGLGGEQPLLADEQLAGQVQQRAQSVVERAQVGTGKPAFGRELPDRGGLGVQSIKLPARLGVENGGGRGGGRCGEGGCLG